MNRRSLLRIIGLGGASAATEAVAGPAYLGYGQPLPPQAEASWGPASIKASAGSLSRAAQSRLDPMNAIIARAAEIEREREYAMLDWGGAL